MNPGSIGAGAGTGAEEGNGVLRASGAGEVLSWAVRSEPGDVRPHNEDYAGVSALAPDRGSLFVVCDGLGGHLAGEVASRVAVESALASWRGPDPVPAPQALRRAVRAANLAVYDTALGERRRGMATTLTALTLAGREAVVGHVGDSRCYLVRAGGCAQLTTDHSRVGDMLRMGLLSPEQAAAHPGRSQLTRVVGTEPIVQVDISRSEVRNGDVFVLCSDGAWDVLGSAHIATVASRASGGAAGEALTAADTLVGDALKAGSPDNVTAVVVTVTGDQPVPAVPPRRSLFRRDRR